MENIGDDRENLNDFLEEAELEQYYELFRDILKVTKVSQLKFVATEDLVHIGLSKPEQRRYKKIFSKHFPNPYISKIKKLLSSNKKNDMYPHGTSTLPLDTQPFCESNVKVPTKHIISIEDITINKELGMGQFGVVQQGTWCTGSQRLQVAIKCLGHERMTSNSTEFLKEAAVMHSIEHPNIVRLYGVVLHMDSLMLVTELAPLRSLLECLREVSLRPNFPVPNLCEFAEQICDGMTYLEIKRLIHRDLAARNILVFSKDRVKISDFGLSRALGVGKDYYQTNYNVNLKLPVAWCAPECILYLRFTSASDVWAFGVCLWEMFTYGFQPWAAFSGQQILETIDAPNFQRLERPECCSEAYYSIMLECWVHDPNARPKFKDLGPRLREIRPEQVQVIANFPKPEDGRRSNLLEYKTGQIITVLGKENMTNSSMWYGVLPGGACGLFDPNQMRPYYRPAPPRQIVAPYKPSEDLEQQPLINPNSPSHLTGTCTSPYPLLTPSDTNNGCDKMGISSGDSKTRSLRKSSNKSTLEPTTSKSFLNKVKSATLGRSHKAEDVTSKADEVHEYHEISDTDTESNATDNVRAENLVLPESPGMPKSYGDFSQSLLDEMESLFKSFDGQQRDEMDASSRREIDAAVRSHTLNKMDKKKNFHTGTMKPMSAHDQKTLDTACALANEITTKSMNDLDGDNKLPISPTDKSKFHFKFPQLSLHHNTHHETDKENTGKQERRNFSEEANSVPDIQSTITEESKLAYSSLIEQPTPSSSLISHMSKDAKGAIHKPGLMPKPSTMPKPATMPKPTSMPKPATMPKPVPRILETKHFNTIQKASFLNVRQINDEFDHQIPSTSMNLLPLPPRNTKPKLVDKPRHIRKYPLKLPMPLPTAEVNAIYQNAMLPGNMNMNLPNVDDNLNLPVDVCVNVCVDVCDGVATNPFNPSENPFDCYLEDTLEYKDGNDDEEDEKKEVEGNLVKDCTDHVSVEDLLEFADQKPCGRQRGVESDEVRIMNKVLKKQATPEECLQALELSEWDVHLAIKVIRVKLAANKEVTLERCSAELATVNGDITKASALVLNKTDNA